MKVKDYYKIMGLKRTASSTQIKERYRELCRMFHPDKNGESRYSVEKFQEIAEAYNILGNLEKRLEYSRYLHENKIVRDAVALRDYEYRKKHGISIS